MMCLVLWKNSEFLSAWLFSEQQIISFFFYKKKKYNIMIDTELLTVQNVGGRTLFLMAKSFFNTFYIS